MLSSVHLADTASWIDLREYDCERQHMLCSTACNCTIQDSNYMCSCNIPPLQASVTLKTVVPRPSLRAHFVSCFVVLMCPSLILPPRPAYTPYARLAAHASCMLLVIHLYHQFYDNNNGIHPLHLNHCSYSYSGSTRFFDLLYASTNSLQPLMFSGVFVTQDVSSYPFHFTK